MQALILAAILNQATPSLCQQWIDRVEQESRYASRLVWSPRKARHIKRLNEAADMAREHCESEQAEQLAARHTVASPAEHSSR